MKSILTILTILLFSLYGGSASGEVTAPPPSGSQLAEDDNSCATCHGEADLWEADTLRLHISKESLAEDVHFKKGVNCHDCHGGNPSSFQPGETHATADGFRPLAEVRKSCALCHKDQAIELIKGMHAKAGPKDDNGSGTVLDCSACHGEKVHGMLPTDDSRSPVFIDHQVKTCGGCHEKYLETYIASVHGHGLQQSGLTVTASCADCHGAHGVYLAPDKRSTLHVSNVAGTCGKCHRFIEERLQASVHGNGTASAEAADKIAPGGKGTRKPTCSDCHQGHDLPHPKSKAFRLSLPNRCGNCHRDLSGRYAISLHGQLTKLSYDPAAKCSDCHGAHDILPISDPQSRLSSANRLTTCKHCHVYASGNFGDFHPHADHKEWGQHPVLHGVYVGMEILLYSVFGLFGLHTVAWFLRSLIHMLQHGRPQRLAAGQRAYIRFEPIHRILHVIVIVSFLGLALTGLPLKYSDQLWAQNLAYVLGGFDSTSLWHRIFAIATVFYAVVHLVWLAKRVSILRGQKMAWTVILFGPDSILPNFRDGQDVLRMIRWFCGLGPKPVFERWAYWEKFDYWAVFWGIGIIGTSGLILWFPNFFCILLPGGALNIAKVIHSEEALLATGFIFAIHFFNTHFRPDKFPMDLSILTGLVSEEDMREERPEHLERLQQARLEQITTAGVQKDHPDYLEQLHQQGKLQELRANTPAKVTLWLIILAGFLALGVGLSLLVGMVIAGLGG